MPDQVTAGSQPDWYVGFLDGALRLMPNWEIVLPTGNTLSINVLFPAMIFAPALLTLLALYPWIERFATRDSGEHHLLDRPRNVPVRTAIGAATVSLYIVLMIGGGNDVIAYNFDLSINTMIRVLQVSLFVVPVITFIVTKRIALSLQRRDRDLLLHGRETGRILRLPSGEFLEIHEPVDEETRAKIMAKEDVAPLALPEAVDEHGVANPKAKSGKRASKLSRFYYKDNVPLPTEEELAEAQHHIEHELHDAVAAGSEAAREIEEHRPV
jgi:ubiquinol-cytochrome c reductase cytochrome b subunit